MNNFLCINYQIYNKINSTEVIDSNDVESIMLSCIDNRDTNTHKCQAFTYRLIKPQLSLNRLFELAKEENLKISESNS